MRYHEYLLYRLKQGREPNSRGQPATEDTMAKPNGITKKGSRYKVTLDTHGQRVHIGYYKTLEAAEKALKKAQEDAGHGD